MKLFKSAALAIGLATGLASTAFAAPVSFSFSSTVTEDSAGGGTIGDSVTGSLTYDTDALTTSLTMAPGGTDFYTTTGQLSMTVGGNTWTSTGDLSIQIRDDWSVGTDFYDAFIVLGMNPTGPSVNGNTPSLVQLSLVTDFLPSVPSVITGNGLPSNLVSSDWSDTSFSSYLTTLFQTPTNNYAGRIFSRQLTVSQPAAVPLPAGGVLLISGFAIAAGVARRKRKAS